MNIEFRTLKKPTEISDWRLILQLNEAEKSKNNPKINFTAEVSDLELWKKLDFIKHGTEIPLGMSKWLVTASAPASCLNEIHTLSYVSKMHGARQVKPLKQ